MIDRQRLRGKTVDIAITSRDLGLLVGRPVINPSEWASRESRTPMDQQVRDQGSVASVKEDTDRRTVGVKVKIWIVKWISTGLVFGCTSSHPGLVVPDGLRAQCEIRDRGGAGNGLLEQAAKENQMLIGGSINVGLGDLIVSAANTEIICPVVNKVGSGNGDCSYIGVHGTNRALARSQIIDDRTKSVVTACQRSSGDTISCNVLIDTRGKIV